MKSFFQKAKAWIRDFIVVISNPSCWMQNHPYCPKWDKLINEAAEIGIIQYKGNNSARMVIERQAPEQDIGIWIANHPYASFTSYPTSEQIWDGVFVPRRRPSRATIIKLGKIYKKEVEQAK